MYEINLYKTANEKEPYTEWLQSLDRSTRAKINARITRIRDTGNLGVYKPIEDGIFEIKIDLGPGYRIYFGLEKNILLILLLGGNKSNQQKDINKAKEYWNDHLYLRKGKNEKL